MYDSPNRAALPFAELLERRTDDAATLHHAVSSHPDVRQVASDDAVIHDDRLNTQKQNRSYIISKETCFVDVVMFRFVFFLSFSYFAIQDDVLTPTKD